MVHTIIAVEAGARQLKEEGAEDLRGWVCEILRQVTYFSHARTFYEQRDGVVMGSPVSAVVANLYMKFFKELALDTAPAKPRLWKRYIDDTCCIVKKDATERLLDHLNSV